MKQDEYLDKLPENLRLIIQLTDYRTAMILIKHYGGSDYSFPPLKSISENHELAELLGFNNLKKLCQYWNGDVVYIPKSDRYLGILRDKRIEQDLAELGADSKIQRELARKYNVTTRWIRSVRKNQLSPSMKNKTSNQLDMFA
ncbi:MAG: Mor transcription activator family protein [Acinetobacter sp.]